MKSTRKKEISMKKLVAVVALVLGFSTAAHAALMIEPYLGYEMGKGTYNSVDFKTDFVNLGLRLGYKTPVMLWVALDGNLSMSGDYKPDSGSNETAKRTTGYGVVGIDLPIFLRAWAGYGFSDDMKIDWSPSGTFSGHNFKLGVGFTMLPFISINAEYIKDTFDNYNSHSVDHSSAMLSVSLPLDI
jgi:hypothetical protein